MPHPAVSDGSICFTLRALCPTELLPHPVSTEFNRAEGTGPWKQQSWGTLGKRPLCPQAAHFTSCLSSKEEDHRAGMLGGMPGAKAAMRPSSGVGSPGARPHVHAG